MTVESPQTPLGVLTARLLPNLMLAMIASPKALQATCFAPSIRRAKS